MFTHNPFTAVTDFLSPLAMQAYLVPMVLAAVIGTLFDISHKGSAKFFALRRDRLLASHARKELWLRTRIVRGRVPSLRVSGVVSPNQRNL
jgi:hypothetical protein